MQANAVESDLYRCAVSMTASQIRTRLSRDWLVGIAAGQVLQVFDQRWSLLRANFKNFDKSHARPQILLADADPTQFLGGFFAAVAAGCPVFLANPAWGQAEWQSVRAQVQPQQIWSTDPQIRAMRQGKPAPSSSPATASAAKTVMIPTGGTSGQVRFVVHTWETLMASVAGFCEFFSMASQRMGDRPNVGLPAVNAYCVLPLYHVSGLMQVLRCFATGGTLAVASFRSLEQEQVLPLPPDISFISLVPTQLQRLIRSPRHIEWLAQFQAVLLGGAPAWNPLLQKAQTHGIRLAPTYGMTETASQIATLKPDEFLAKEPRLGWVGSVLPHAQVTICDDAGNGLPPGQVGAIAIRSHSLAWGYFASDLASIAAKQVWQTYSPDDLGYFDEAGQLHIVGRNSDKIISGGENIFPAEVEAAIRATGQVEDVAVLGLPDDCWGEVVTAVYVAVHPKNSLENVGIALGDRLSPYKRPKRWIAVDSLPRNAQGKLDRTQLKQMAIARQNHST